MSQLVSSDEIAKLTEGSFEHLTARLNKALEGKMVKDGPSFRVIGTFPGHAVVAATDGKFSKVTFESVDGEIKIGSSEELPVESYGPDRINAFIDKNAEKLIDLFFNGDLVEAKDRIAALATTALSAPPRESPLAMVEGTLSSLNAPRSWSTTMQESRAVIEAAVPGIEQFIPEEPIFAELEKLPLDKHEAVRALVLDRLTTLEGRIKKIAINVTEALEPLAAIEVDESEQDTFGGFLAFCEDLLDDLAKVSKAVAEALSTPKPVAVLGKLYDGIATSFHNREIAASYATSMAKSLADNS